MQKYRCDHPVQDFFCLPSPPDSFTLFTLFLPPAVQSKGFKMTYRADVPTDQASPAQQIAALSKTLAGLKSSIDKFSAVKGSVGLPGPKGPKGPSGPLGTKGHFRRPLGGRYPRPLSKTARQSGALRTAASGAVFQASSSIVGGDATTEVRGQLFGPIWTLFRLGSLP